MIGIVRLSLFRQFLWWSIALLLALCILGVQTGKAQVVPPQRMVRTYVPPDQLVSFSPSTPFNQFIELLNPIFQRVLKKQIIDPEGHDFEIGIPIEGMYFLDAFNMVLAKHRLKYRETDGYIIVEPSNEWEEIQEEEAPESLPAHATTREIQIDAVLFEVNLTRLRELGINWTTLFKGGQGGNSGFRLKTSEIFDPLSSILEAPDVIDLDRVTDILRTFETQGIGRTLANPQITVQSGEIGQVQVGADIPVQIRDFAGNTVTQFVQTGIIIKVTPTLIRETITDSLGQDMPIEFVHLDVNVEKSSGQLGEAGIIINRNRADTQVLLLDGERTIIGGLYTSEESSTRKGVPLLKDLPWWFFGLRYIFGFESKSLIQKELIIVLGARIVEPLYVRMKAPRPDNLLEQQRMEWRDRLRRLGATDAQIKHLESLQRRGQK